MPDGHGTKKETLRLDLVGRSSDKYKSADTHIQHGHWWTHEKTSKGKDYYQEGDHVYDELNVLEAFQKALTTWAKWVDANVDPLKTMVFFRGYSAVHFSGGQWNSGGACDTQIEPIRNETLLRRYLPKMLVLESVLKGMKMHVTYLNITRLTDFRKDGHPSIYRRHRGHRMSEKERAESVKHQDCSHWCLPGVPDSWNELLYSELLVKEIKMRQHQGKAR
ncbi:Protein trichome birefringence [Hibiscus syriacus]|uniref:Protein trichome birefringence n=1 Tax=Hibiscus syriacus TaxID=106335 RepID=A0A6A3BC29_HIBSY|nr:Protein trichome birefringence [Hibiscus syriacus]